MFYVKLDIDQNDAVVTVKYIHYSVNLQGYAKFTDLFIPVQTIIIIEQLLNTALKRLKVNFFLFFPGSCSSF